MARLIRSYLTNRIPQSSSRLALLFQNLFSPSARWLALFAVVLMLAGCGPARAANNEAQMREEITRIAQQFQADQDLAKASAALESLDVANPRQWLMLQTEESITTNADPVVAASMVKLTEALNIQSSVIRTYAEQQGLAAPTPTFIIDEVAVVQTPQPAPLSTPAQVVIVTSEPVAPDSEATSTPAVLIDLATPAEQSSASAAPQGKATGLINVRSGPGTDFSAVAALNSDEIVQLIAKTPAGDWWQISLANGATGWVFGQLLETMGDVSGVTVAADIPTAPTTAPVAVAEQPASTAADISTPPSAPLTAPVADAAPTAAPAAELTATAAPAGSPSDQPYFKLVSSRMWNKAENGDCRGQHLLRINVIDANGVRINGVRLKGIYTGEVMVTGSQGKGDGVIEYDLYSTGEGFTVIQNDDGREAASDRAEGFTTQSRDISQDLLIAGGYCTNASDCQIFYDSWGCNGHHSWEATFQRNY
jgi:uncharacterized protein YraI